MKNPNCLLVEGNDDFHSVIHLLKRHTSWGKGSEPVNIIKCNGDDPLLDENNIPLRLKASDTDVLGIIIDADGNCAGRWQRIRQLCEPYIEDMPQELPEEGLVIQTKLQKKFGVWIMPNNKEDGMLETFLHRLVPAKYKKTMDYAKEVTREARREFDAPYLPAHYDKAVAHTWLAWMDPPGKTFGTAFMSGILDAGAGAAEPFVRWFRDLYGI